MVGSYDFYDSWEWFLVVDLSEEMYTTRKYIVLQDVHARLKSDGEPCGVR